jgi:hypothetical protein
MSLQEVLDIAVELRTQGVRAVALHTNLEIGNEQASVDGLSQSYEGRAATVIRGAIIESLVMVTQRMSDPGNSDKLTIAKAAQLLQDPATRSQVGARGDATSITLFLDAAKAMETNAALKRLRKVRNFAIAHLIPSKREKAFHADVAEGLKVVLDVTHLLSVGAGTVAMTFDPDRQVWSDRNRAYWNRLLASPSIPDPEISRHLAKGR